MVPEGNQNERINQIIEAFRNETPAFEADPQQDVFTFNGRIGVRAQNQSACHKPGRTKWAYYVEGTHYEMGYLLGLMAEPQIERMCTEFNRKVLFEFVNINFRTQSLASILGEFLETLLYRLSEKIEPDVPDEYKQELRGILDGCTEANPQTQVDWQELWVLNVGFDALLSYVYTGSLPITADLPVTVTPDHLKVPLQCNGFSVSGPAAEGNGHFLGRDFMFPTAGVFEDTACLMIQNPQDPAGAVKHPFVSQTAPGMIGCIAGMNIEGLGAGVDMSPSGNCDPSRPGFNSLLLARHSIENGATCEQAVEIMEEAQRGVSWLYILADAKSQKACVVEAGAKVDQSDFLEYASRRLQALLADPSYEEQLPDQLMQSLPDPSFLETQARAEFRKGLMVRWNNYDYPREYLRFNEKLFRLFDKDYNPGNFGERGYLVNTWKDKSCPHGYYFAPQRENDPHLVIVTNMCILPEMRLYAMHPWTNLIASSDYDDIQWRYDELNNQLLTRLYPEPDGEVQPLTLEEAKGLINYLTPDPEKGRFPTYYNPPPGRKGLQRLWDLLRHLIRGEDSPTPSSGDWRDVQIHGSISLMDLGERTMHSYYGLYGDGWVTVHLGEYV